MSGPVSIENRFPSEVAKISTEQVFDPVTTCKKVYKRYQRSPMGAFYTWFLTVIKTGNFV